jgi:hypothetical protein
MRILAILLVSLSFSPAMAEDCSGRDLSAELGPVRDQGNIGWCYANAAADLLSFRYRKELKEARLKLERITNPQATIDDIGVVQISAVHAAITYNRVFAWDPEKEGGYVREATWGAKHFGMCLSDLDLEFARGSSMKDALYQVNEIKTVYDAKSAEFPLKLERLIGPGGKFEGVSQSRLMEVLANSSTDNFPKRFANLLCGARAFPKPFEVDTENNKNAWYETDTPMETLEKQITNNNVVAISYFANFLTDPEGRKEGAHASVIVGRRKNTETGKCEYLIRNSWGSSCDGYRAPYNRLDGYYCQNGHIWVEADTIRANLMAVTHIKD